MANARRKLGVNIYTLMQNSGISREDFAKRICFSKRDATRVFEGRIFLSPLQLKNIADVLGTTQDKLLDFNSDKVAPELQYMKEFDNPDNLDKVLDLIDEYVELKESV